MDRAFKALGAIGTLVGLPPVKGEPIAHDAHEARKGVSPSACAPTATVQPVDLAQASAAGEEDPGAALDTQPATPPARRDGP